MSQLFNSYAQSTDPSNGRTRRTCPIPFAPLGLRFVREHRNALLVVERLNTIAGRRDRPHCCYLSTVIFYRDQHIGPPREIDRADGVIHCGGWTEILIWWRGSWWAIGGSMACWMDFGWHRVTQCYRNMPEAIAANRETWLYEGWRGRNPVARRLIAATRPLRDLLRTLRLWPGKPRRGQEIFWYLRD